MQKIFVLLFFLLFAGQVLHAQMPPAAPVTVTEVTQKEVRKPVTLVGSVEPLRKSLVSAEISGIVVDYPFTQGEYVEEGQIIASQNVSRMKLMLNEAINAREESKARLKLAEDELRRINELHEKGIVSRSQLDNAVSEKEALFSRHKLLQSRIKQLEYDLNQTNIRAPFNGYITEEHSQVGEWLDSGDNVVELIDIDTVEIKVDMPEKYVHQVKKGDEVSVTFNSLPGKEFAGKIVSIVPQADQASRAFPVKINLDNKDHIIKSSMSARVSFLLGDTVEVKLVPKDAITDSNGVKMLFVVREGAAVPLTVMTGIEDGGKVQVEGEVNVGEQVVVRGNERLQPMQPVEVTSIIE